jgi:hypothetical protein
MRYYPSFGSGQTMEKHSGKRQKGSDERPTLSNGTDRWASPDGLTFHPVLNEAHEPEQSHRRLPRNA